MKAEIININGGTEAPEGDHFRDPNFASFPLLKYLFIHALASPRAQFALEHLLFLICSWKI